MKLHLPSRLRSSVLLCLSAFSALSSTLSTGILSSSAVVISLAASPAKGAPIVDKTFEYAGTTYSGAELVTLDVSNTANVAAGGASHAISRVANMTVTLDVDGTPTDKKMTEKVHALNSTDYSSDNYDYEIWKSFCGSKESNDGNRAIYGYGQTMKLTGADAAWTLTLDFTPIDFGGLITEAATDSGSYTIGRSSFSKSSSLNITANETAGANMHINAETTLVGSSASINTSGTWVLNKNLTFAEFTTVAAGKQIAIAGEGALNISGDLTLNAGSRIVGENNAINATGTLTLNLSGLTSGAAPLISTEGAVAANGFTLVDYPPLEVGEYALISTTDSSASALANLFTNNDRYSVSNRNGLVLLTVSENPEGCFIFASRLTSSGEMVGYERILFTESHANASGGAIYNGDSFTMNDNKSVTFSGNSAAYYYDGGAIYNEGSFTMNNNAAVTFSGNSAANHDGGAINNRNSFSLSSNEVVTFEENAAAYGGAIYNDGVRSKDNNAFITLSDNETVTFSRNSANSCGGAIYNYRNASRFVIARNRNVIFSENSAATGGGAIYNFGVFTLSDNGDVTFSRNTAAEGGAIYNSGTFTLSGNGDVVFEKNYEKVSNSYRLRSIYSVEGTLNLSASAGKSILFKDSVYASGTVNLNQGGTGDIIFSGATTEADLREVKGGVNGTAEEILNSRTSEIATNATLYGGRLIVEDGAILKGCGITVTEGANATVRLNGATLDETGYAIAVSSGSGLEFVRENTLAASAVSLADNSFLSFALDEALTAVNWDADLDIQGGLTLNLTHEDKPVHETYALLAMQSGNTVTGWEAANLSISGASAEHLVWENNTLYYRPMLVQENGDTTLDTDVGTNATGGTIGGKDDVVIDGNGHTLTVKNAVQLVQMALKNGTVKLEGENNNVVSVTLTEGGELVLTAGAGLKTGDIISMVANGKGELVISGDITLDDKGMKGKNGNLATVNHADMKVLGDASISNVRVEDSSIDLMEGSTVNFTNVVLSADARITDDPATANLNNVYAELVLGVNTEQTDRGTLSTGSVLTQTGNTGETLTLTGDSPVLMLEATTFDSLTLTGTSLTLSLSGMTQEEFDAASIIGIAFTSGKDYAVFDSSLAVLLTLDGGITFTPGYTLGGDGTTLYFCGANAPVVPEPATATLSLLALSALAVRRKRK